MSAATVNLAVEQGAYWSQPLLWKDSAGTPVDLSGYTAKMQVRDSSESSGTPVVSLTETSGITLGGAAGTILLELDAAATAALPALGNRTYVYDLLLTPPDGETVRLIQGTFAVSASVTQ